MGSNTMSLERKQSYIKMKLRCYTLEDDNLIVAGAVVTRGSQQKKLHNSSQTSKTRSKQLHVLRAKNLELHTNKYSKENIKFKKLCYVYLLFFTHALTLAKEIGWEQRYFVYVLDGYWSGQWSLSDFVALTFAFCFCLHMNYDIKPTFAYTESSGVARSNVLACRKLWGSIMFAFRRITLFCLGCHILKHKMTRRWGHAPLTTPMTEDCLSCIWFFTYLFVFCWLWITKMSRL